MSKTSGSKYAPVYSFRDQFDESDIQSDSSLSRNGSLTTVVSRRGREPISGDVSTNAAIAGGATGIAAFGVSLGALAGLSRNLGAGSREATSDEVSRIRSSMEESGKKYIYTDDSTGAYQLRGGPGAKKLKPNVKGLEDKNSVNINIPHFQTSSIRQDTRAVLAHELGHAQGSGNLQKLMPVTRIGLMGMGIPMALGTNYMAHSSDKNIRRASVVAPILLAAPGLAEEARASINARRHLKSLGMWDNSDRNQLLAAYATYFGAWGAPALMSSAANYYVHRKKTREEDEKANGEQMNKKASLSEYLDATQIKREDTDAYLRYLGRWHDHHDAQMNPKFGVKFAHTRADAQVDMEKVAFLGGLASRAASATGRAVGGGARMAGSAVNRVSQAGSRISQIGAAGRSRMASAKNSIIGSYNQGRHGSVMGNAAQFEAKTLAANPNLAGPRKPFQAIGKPQVEYAPKSGVESLKERLSAASSGAKDRFSKLDPRAQTAAKVGAGVVGAYGAYRVGKGAYNRFADNREQQERYR